MERRQGYTNKRVRLRDVAAKVGLSSAQASRALAGYADVAPATRERVVQTALEMGYRSSARARSLRLGNAAARRCAVVLLGQTTEASSLLKDLFMIF